jgi:hypothetical protein
MLTTPVTELLIVKARCKVDRTVFEKQVKVRRLPRNRYRLQVTCPTCIRTYSYNEENNVFFCDRPLEIIYSYNNTSSIIIDS